MKVTKETKLSDYAMRGKHPDSGYLTTRVCRILQNGDLKSYRRAHPVLDIEDLLEKSFHDLRDYKMMGMSAINNIRDFLDTHGFSIEHLNWTPKIKIIPEPRFKIEIYGSFKINNKAMFYYLKKICESEKIKSKFQTRYNE